MEFNMEFVIFVIFLAFVFDFINGFHDAGSSIATIVTTNVLTPRQAVLWAAFFNFIAFLVFNLMVAKTIGQGLIDIRLVTPELIFSALVAAIAWNLLTWFWGLPSSASHALIGGLSGAAMMKAGLAALIPSGFIKVFIGIVVAPLVGIIIGGIVMAYFTWLLNTDNDRKHHKLFKRLQLLSSAFLSLTHGGNDAQKTMGIIALLLFSVSASNEPFHIPLWVVIACHAVISLGTLFGGWRIVHTMGTQITTLTPKRGCAAETGAALLLFAATEGGIPMSTTQTVTGAIAGVGLYKGLKGIQWSTLLRIFLSWIFTIPVVALVAAMVAWLIN